MNGTGSIAIVADRLIDGTGRDPVADAVLVVDDGRITAVGPRSAVRIPDGAEIVEGDDLTLLPGFIDCHVHLAGQSGVDFNRLLMTQRSMLLLMAVPNAAVTLQAGVTTVRDAGLSPASVRDAIDAGYFPGPRCHMAVTILSQSGGHGDPTMPCGCDLYMDCGMDVPDAVVDGADMMRRRVARGARGRRRLDQALHEWRRALTLGPSRCRAVHRRRDLGRGRRGRRARQARDGARDVDGRHQERVARRRHQHRARVLPRRRGDRADERA